MSRRVWNPGLHYDPGFLMAADRVAIVDWLAHLKPLWERRFSPNHPPPEGKSDRPLLRPVYWLGGWQFACLGYYRPPRFTAARCVEGEPYPPVLQKLVAKIEKRVRQLFPPAFVPRGWQLNTCLVNLYGDRVLDGKTVDTARVGEHKDFEPGPVASLSLGERALFQFVSSRGKNAPSRVLLQQWLEDGSLQIFGGERWKNQLFHRVQRVEYRQGFHFPVQVEGFDTRRVNFTFRFVPPRDILAVKDLPPPDLSDVRDYVRTLAQSSDFWRQRARTL